MDSRIVSVDISKTELIDMVEVGQVLDVLRRRGNYSISQMLLILELAREEILTMRVDELPKKERRPCTANTAAADVGTIE